MLETAEAYFHLDDPVAPGAPFYAGPRLLRGWSVGRGACFITDLRVRVGSRIFPVFYGHPRPDVAQFLGVNRPCFPAGFEVELLLGPGENQVEFQLCDAAGRWRTLHTAVLNTTPAQPVEWRRDTAAVHAPEFARGLRLVLQRSVDDDVTSAAKAVAASFPTPFVTRFPALPFHGHLHQPPMLQRADFGRLIVEGWLFHESARIRRVAASIDLQAWATLHYGNEQPYVAGLYPQFPHARHSRLEGFIDAPSHLPQPVSLRVFAELEDGSWHLCHVQRNHVHDGESNKAPYGAFSPLRFARAAWEFRQACLARQLTVPQGRRLFEALREVWQEYRARASSLRAPAASARELPLDASAPAPQRVLLVTHNLNYEGAPLFLLELAQHLRARGSSLAVISAAEGPLRAEFAPLGAKVGLLDVAPLFAARSTAELQDALRRLGADESFADCDLVVANTLSAWWAIHLAAAAGRRSLLYIHESTTPEAFYHGHAQPALLPFVKRTFALATHVSFLTEATRRYYYPVLPRANHSLNAGWIDHPRLTAFRAANSRASLRARLGFPADTKIVINVGSVCDRKGQHIFARAVDLLWRGQPELAARCRFLMVGGRHTSFDAHLDELVAQLGRDNLAVVRETPTPYDYYGAADLFVCSSYEESFPRVILEAMAFELPIVSTGVHGVPEMARHEAEAWLVPPGDPSALADGMAKLLLDESTAHRFALQAAAR
ncbi:MAG: glycosyltransferase family 4 protein, partial [Candidatus Didemnitutus sp.]|nr:glycosyltransferase family 4 protein [Candidatus Didemnitutus sp.]